MCWFSCSWLNRSKRQTALSPRIIPKSRSQRLRLRLRLEELECRNLPSTISLVPSEPAPQLVGQPITWTATVSNGPTAGLVYQFSDGPIDGPFHMVRDFSPNNTFTWAPMEEGEYKIKVTVKQGFAATDAESAVVHDVVNSRITGSEAVTTPTSNPLVVLYSAPPLAEDASHDELTQLPQFGPFFDNSVPVSGRKSFIGPTSLSKRRCSANLPS
jgi:hypothetical protein